MANVVLFTDLGDVDHIKPAGTYRIATELRARGYTCQVIDHFMYLTQEQLFLAVDKFVDDTTVIVGFSSSYMVKDLDVKKRLESFKTAGGIPLTSEQGAELKARILKKNPKVKLVKGGHRIRFANKTYNDSFIDAFMYGYSEGMLPAYIEYLKGKNPFFQFKKRNKTQIRIDYDQNGELFTNFKDCSIKWEPNDIVRQHEPLPLEIARGCIFQCKFCSTPLQGKKNFDYIRTGEAIYQELLRNYEMYGTTNYTLLDETFNDSMHKLDVVGNAIKRLPFKIQYTCYLRHDLIYAKREMADILEETGLVGCQFGIETLNQRAGKAIGKGLAPEKTIELLYWLRAKWGNKILTESNFLLGLPEDTMPEMEEWVETILKPDFPLHSWNLNATMVHYFSPSRKVQLKASNDIYMSDLAFNSDKYGYIFPKCKEGVPFSVHDSHNWVNIKSGATYEAVMKLRENVNSRKIPQHLRCWSIMSMQNLGYTYDELHNNKVPYFKSSGALSKRMKLVDSYYKSLMAL
jgi:hypothetical protein